MKWKLFRIVPLLALVLTIARAEAQEVAPKREMRAAWIATVDNIDWPTERGLSAIEQQKELIAMLDSLKAIGINAVVMQIRPNADALYQPGLEPWSKWLTGKMGVAPDPYYDPLAFTIEECHKRYMEVHAWFNPYRTAGVDEELVDEQHVTRTHPEWLVTYGKMRYFDPGLPETRAFVTRVIQDVVRRYDIDGVHFDDYFYPYKVKGQEFNDSASFAAYPRGFASNQRDDWRRDNVNIIIKMLSDSIHAIKPYVKFGISPFGIWRNVANDPRGSETSGGQNYDDLYADILWWMQKGWIDYVVPQLYWHIGFKVADYEKLAKWWAKNSNGVQLYVGHGAYRTSAASKTKEWADGMEINRQLTLNRVIPEIKGSCYFSAQSLYKNLVGVSTNMKRDFYQYPALIPTMPQKDSVAPAAPTSIRLYKGKDGVMVTWNSAKDSGMPLDATRYYVVYRMDKHSDTNRAQSIYAITRDCSVMIPYSSQGRKVKYRIAVTALDRLSNESAPTPPVTVKL